MADSAPMNNFLTALAQKMGLPKKIIRPPKRNGRPPKTPTMADLAPLPKGMQTRNPTRNHIPKLPAAPGGM